MTSPGLMDLSARMMKPLARLEITFCRPKPRPRPRAQAQENQQDQAAFQEVQQAGARPADSYGNVVQQAQGGIEILGEGQDRHNPHQNGNRYPDYFISALKDIEDEGNGDSCQNPG